jgi:hypothetical protein
MTEIPRSIVNALATILPGDTLTVHRGRGSWMKIEVAIMSKHRWGQRCPPALWEEVFQNLSENFWGSLTFTYDFEGKEWMYQVRVCPPIENKLTVTVVSE